MIKYDRLLACRRLGPQPREANSLSYLIRGFCMCHRFSLLAKALLFLAVILLAQPNLMAQTWTVIAQDAKGDGKDPSLPDAAMLAYRYDKQADILWFRIAVYRGLKPNAFGVNLIFDTDTGAEKLNWSGMNSGFRFDKILTARVTRDDKGYSGTIGIGDAAGVKANKLNNLLQNNLRIIPESDAVLIGVKRTDLTDGMKMKVVASVGSNEVWNDDVPNVGSAAVDLTAPKPTQGLREIDTQRNNFHFPPGIRTIAADQMAANTRRGRGKQPLILIPGVYSGLSSFDEFIARNQSLYTFYIITPPGLDDTPPRAMPSDDLKLGERPWTRLLERDVLRLIKVRRLVSPVIVTDSHPGSTAALDIAIENPSVIGGVVIVGTNLIQFLPSPKDPTRRTPINASDRVRLVEDGWALQWFKYVTPETWLSNDMRPEMLSRELQRGQKAVEEIERAPLEVKIRYLCEFWASDVTTNFDKLHVPVLVLTPGFDEKYLSDPAHVFTKMAYVDLWDKVIPKSPYVDIVKIDNARLLVLDDQPVLSDQTIAAFVRRLRH